MTITSTRSIDTIIGYLQEKRDSIINDLLDDRAPHPFVENQYRQVASSPVRLEFLKRELRELKKTKLDLAHYAGLIKQIKESHTTAALDNSVLFQQEMKTIVGKYAF